MGDPFAPDPFAPFARSGRLYGRNRCPAGQGRLATRSDGSPAREIMPRAPLCKTDVAWLCRSCKMIS
ncbi:MAG: hypothetical protein B5M56_10765 [Desulfococcus sp. 4484_241]|nr:MAG: hypothetical protein B5M56_10765 [Desulfococcus sp. 4484_241]